MVARLSRLACNDATLIFVVSCITTALQFGLTRLLSFAYWHHVVYATISFALLGYGIATVFYVIFRDRLQRLGSDALKAWAILAFTVTLPIALAITSLCNLDTPLLWSGDLGALMRLPLVYASLTVPFVALGFLVIHIFDHRTGEFSRLYAIDLVGAALGVLAFLCIFPILGALKFLLSLSGVLYFVGLLQRVTLARPWTIAVAPIAIGVALLLGFSPSETKTLGKLNDQFPDAAHQYTAWDPIARIDITDLAPLEGKSTNILWATLHGPASLITNDADAYAMIIPGSSTLHFKEVFGSDVEFALRPRGARAAIIGIGGGMDIHFALEQGASHVDAVEINGATIRAMMGPFAALSNNAYLRPEVSVFHQDGRSFIANSHEHYDVIHMFGVDTFAAASQGAYANAESYLYTTDALIDYFNHLSADGFISIHRWGVPRESLRLFVEAFYALQRSGVEHPEQHVMEVRNRMSGWGQLLVSKRPLDDTLMSQVRERMEDWPSDIQYAPDRIDRYDLRNDYAVFARSWLAKKEMEFIDSYTYDISPVSDDDPFFFKYYRVGGLFSHGRRSQMDMVHGYWPFIVFLIVIAQSIVLTGLFIFVPLAIYERRGLRPRGVSLVLTYFACLGLGFILVEIGLMQSMALVLDHPVYAMAAVLMTMLLSAGLGSLTMDYAPVSARKAIAIAGAGTLTTLVVFTVLKARFVAHFLGEPFAIRLAAVVATSAAIAYFMGFFFPVGLRVIRGISQAFVPWAWGVNAGFTVIGSMMAIMMAMTSGFTYVFGLATVTYGVAVASLLLLTKRSTAPV